MSEAHECICLECSDRQGLFTRLSFNKVAVAADSASGLADSHAPGAAPHVEANDSPLQTLASTGMVYQGLEHGVTQHSKNVLGAIEMAPLPLNGLMQEALMNSAVCKLRSILALCIA